jgi:hypothetical protein
VSTYKNPVLVVEDDPFLRVVGILLDPTTSAERYAAYADFFAHDDPDFDGYCARVRARIGPLFPSQVRLVESPEEMRAILPGARGLIVESPPVRILLRCKNTVPCPATSTRRPARSAASRC